MSYSTSSFLRNKRPNHDAPQTINLQETSSTEEPTPIDSRTLDFLADHRFLNGTETMLINLDRCTRCDDCVRACAATHDNNPRFVRQGSKHDQLMVANACMHCVDPVCMIGCPTGADRPRPGDWRGANQRPDLRRLLDLCQQLPLQRDPDGRDSRHGGRDLSRRGHKSAI